MNLVVNGEEIQENEIKAEMRKLLRVYIDRLPPEQIKEKIPDIRKSAEEYVIGRTLLLQEARRREIPIPAVEVENEVDNLKKRCGSEAGYEEHLWNLDMTHDQLMTQIVHARLVEELICELTAEVTEPEEDEALAYFKDNPDMFRKPETVRIAHILAEVNTDADEEKEQAVNKLRVIYRDIMEGADFTELAKKHSDCPSGERSGGEIAEISKGQWLPEIESLAFNMADEEISKPVESAIGYHIVKKLGSSPEQHMSFEEAGAMIKELMIAKQKNEIIENLLDELKQKAVIEGQTL